MYDWIMYQTIKLKLKPTLSAWTLKFVQRKRISNSKFTMLFIQFSTWCFWAFLFNLLNKWSKKFRRREMNFFLFKLFEFCITFHFLFICSFVPSYNKQCDLPSNMIRSNSNVNIFPSEMTNFHCFFDFSDMRMNRYISVFVTNDYQMITLWC